MSSLCGRKKIQTYGSTQPASACCMLNSLGGCLWLDREIFNNNNNKKAIRTVELNRNNSKCTYKFNVQQFQHFASIYLLSFMSYFFLFSDQGRQLFQQRPVKNTTSCTAEINK